MFCSEKFFCVILQKILDIGMVLIVVGNLWLVKLLRNIYMLFEGLWDVNIRFLLNIVIGDNRYLIFGVLIQLGWVILLNICFVIFCLCIKWLLCRDILLCCFWIVLCKCCILVKVLILVCRIMWLQGLLRKFSFLVVR